MQCWLTWCLSFSRRRKVKATFARHMLWTKINQQLNCPPLYFAFQYVLSLFPRRNFWSQWLAYTNWRPLNIIDLGYCRESHGVYFAIYCRVPLNAFARWWPDRSLQGFNSCLKFVQTSGDFCLYCTGYFNYCGLHSANIAILGSKMCTTFSG